MSTYASQCVADFKGRTADYFMRSPSVRLEMANTKFAVAAGYIAEFYPICGPEASEPFLRGLAKMCEDQAEQCRERIKEMND